MSYLDKDVALRKTLGEMVEDRNEAVALWAQGYRVLEMSRKKVEDVSRYGGPRMYDIPGPDKARYEIDKAFWRAAFERTRMMEIMDSKARKEFDKALETKPPVFSLDNIETQYLAMYQNSDEMFLRGIYEVFRHLDHSYWNNNHEPYQISEKNIMGYWLEGWCLSNPRLSYHRSDLVNDIDRCVKVLTGRKHHPRELETKINAALKDQDGPPWIYEDDDYHMKFFKNQNCHLTFKNQDTIDRLNRAIAQYCNHHKLKEAA
jgi:hypothetical protein